MCDDCNWHELLEEIEEMQAAGGYEFAHHTLSGIYETVRRTSTARRGSGRL